MYYVPKLAILLTVTFGLLSDAVTIFGDMDDNKVLEIMSNMTNIYSSTHEGNLTHIAIGENSVNELYSYIKSINPDMEDTNKVDALDKRAIVTCSGEGLALSSANVKSYENEICGALPAGGAGAGEALAFIVNNFGCERINTPSRKTACSFIVQVFFTTTGAYGGSVGNPYCRSSIESIANSCEGGGSIDGAGGIDGISTQSHVSVNYVSESNAGCNDVPNSGYCRVLPT